MRVFFLCIAGVVSFWAVMTIIHIIDGIYLHYKWKLSHERHMLSMLIVNNM